MELKDCPFCGCSKPVYVQMPSYRWYLACLDCGCDGSVGKDKAEAKLKWNKRKKECFTNAIQDNEKRFRGVQS